MIQKHVWENPRQFTISDICVLECAETGTSLYFITQIFMIEAFQCNHRREAKTQLVKITFPGNVRPVDAQHSECARGAGKT